MGQYRNERVHILSNHVSLVYVALDLLANTSALDSQAMLYTVCQPYVGVLLCLWKELLDPVITSHLNKLSLPTLRVYWILPFSCLLVFVE